ncbi:MAG: DegQ family serine endoprotease [Gammaproteobacteria bacterium]|nr:DegQ family serine endoprotease [Gammaproteobacteria bacterium]
MKPFKRLIITLFTLMTVYSAQPVIAAQWFGNTLDANASLAPMLENVLPGVVNIATSGTVSVNQNPMYNDPFFRHFFGVPQQQRRTQSIGSGVIIDANEGYIITNNHVIANADTIFVTLNDKRRLKAKLIGTDPETDVAILKVKPERLTAIPLANSSTLRVGDFVVAIGNPFGLGQTVTSGIISALGRTGLGIEGYENFIQTDASINPGNSGGALINLKGELIGVNTAIVGPSGGNVGIGFAIPVNMAKQVMQQLLEHGSVKRGLLGVQVQDITPDLAEALNLDSVEGTVISAVTEGGAAKKAGLKPGDVILSIDGKPVLSSANLRNAIGLKRVGEKVKIDVIRDGRTKTFKLTIRESNETVSQSNDAPLLQGAEFSEIPRQHPLYRRIDGVMISKLKRGSRIWRSGLEPGDIIVSANRQPVTSVKQLMTIARQARGELLLRIQRDNQSLFVVLR